MNVLIVNTGRENNSALFLAAETLEKRLQEASVMTESIWTGGEELQPCIACGKCNRLKMCVYEDVVNGTARNAGQYDAVIFLAEAYYGRLSAQSLAFLERLFRSAAPAFSGKTAAGVIYTRGSDVTEATGMMYSFFSMADMTVVTSRSRQVIRQKFGTEDEKNMILLAERVIWILEGTAGKQEKSPPEWETEKVTDFVR